MNESWVNFSKSRLNGRSVGFVPIQGGLMSALIIGFAVYGAYTFLKKRRVL
jgi:hypothetical protein